MWRTFLVVRWSMGYFCCLRLKIFVASYRSSVMRTLTTFLPSNKNLESRQTFLAPEDFDRILITWSQWRRGLVEWVCQPKTKTSDFCLQYKICNKSCPCAPGFTFFASDAIFIFLAHLTKWSAELTNLNSLIMIHIQNAEVRVKVKLRLFVKKSHFTHFLENY